MNEKKAAIRKKEYLLWYHSKMSWILAWTLQILVCLFYYQEMRID